MARAGLSKGLRGAIAQGHQVIGGTTLANFRIDILVAYIILLNALISVAKSYISVYLLRGRSGAPRGPPYLLVACREATNPSVDKPDEPDRYCLCLDITR